MVLEKPINLEQNELKQLSNLSLISLILDFDFESNNLLEDNSSQIMELLEKIPPKLNHLNSVKVKALYELLIRVKNELFSKQKKKTKIKSSRDVFELFYPLLKDANQEQVFVLILDSLNQIIKKELLYIGTLNQAIIHPRDIIRILINNPANSFILVHNHPSGDPKPSLQDKRITTRIKRIGSLIKIPLLDHVIIADRTYFSFSDNHLI
ncbi:MAG: repair protein RadC [Candidatus Woesearchaeota archaeon]|nr:repair protein RadC [Candidatus Woesearchaeota archaeon]